MTSTALSKYTKKKEVILIILVVTLIITGYLWLMLHPKSPAINTYQDCINAGNPIIETFPEQCVTKDGRHFTKTNGEVQSLVDGSESR